MPKVVHKNNDSILNSFTGTNESFTRKPYHSPRSSAAASRTARMILS